MENVTNWIAWLSLLVAIVSLAWTKRNASQMAELKRRQVELDEERRSEELDEAGRADLSAFVRLPDVVVTNTGKGHAFGIQLEINGRPWEEHYPLDPALTDLGSNGQWTGRLRPHLGSSDRPSNIRLVWADESGRREWRASL